MNVFAHLVRRQKEKLAACVAHKTKTATKHTKLLAAAINKMASSKVACYVGDDITELREQQTITQASSALLALMSANASPNPGDFIEHAAVLCQCPLAKVSASVQLMAFQQELQHMLTLSDIEGVCRVREEGSAHVTKLSAIGCDIEDMRQVAVSSFFGFCLGIGGLWVGLQRG